MVKQYHGMAEIVISRKVAHLLIVPLDKSRNQMGPVKNVLHIIRYSEIRLELVVKSAYRLHVEIMKSLPQTEPASDVNPINSQIVKVELAS